VARWYGGQSRRSGWGKWKAEWSEGPTPRKRLGVMAKKVRLRIKQVVKTARYVWAPHDSEHAAITAVVDDLRRKGHGILTQGASLECFRCGLSGCVYGSEGQGAHVVGGLASREECTR